MKDKPRHKRRLWLLLFTVMISLSACNLPGASTPTPQVLFPTVSVPASPTAVLVSPTRAPTQTSLPPTPTPTPIPPTSTLSNPTATMTQAPLTTITQGSLTGPYAVVLVEENDVLNVRMGPGINYSIVGTFLSTATNVQWTGEFAIVSDTLWVEVQRKNGVGWVNAYYLSEYVEPDIFCQDTQVTGLLDDFKRALNSADGELFSSLVSPLHGLEVYYWRYGPSANYTAVEASWVFDSTYEVNLGSRSQRPG